jgi:hypothetical protein
METPSYKEMQVTRIETAKTNLTAIRTVTPRNKSTEWANLNPTQRNRRKMEKSSLRTILKSSNRNRRNNRDRRRKKTTNLTSCIIRNKISDGCYPISQYSAAPDPLPSASAVPPQSALT